MRQGALEAARALGKRRTSVLIDSSTGAPVPVPQPLHGVPGGGGSSGVSIPPHSLFLGLEEGAAKQWVIKQPQAQGQEGMRGALGARLSMLLQAASAAIQARQDAQGKGEAAATRVDLRV